MTLLADGNIRLKECRHGRMLYYATDVYVGKSLELYGEWSELEVELYRRIAKPGMMVIEVGANIGAHTLFLANAVGEKGLVIAFEPQRIVFQTLCANLALNRIMNVDARHAAVGGEGGKVVVPRLDFETEQNFGGLHLGDWEHGEPVAVITIDELGLGACHFLKIDAEGMENDVIAGAAETIKKFRPAVVLENDRQEKSPALIQAMLDKDYRLYWHLPPLFNPNNHFGSQENAFPGIASINMLCLPKEVDQNVNLREITSPEDNWRQPPKAE